jgi:tRNA threonylcarbamoyladenosine biosynthesis protein TsaB
MKTLPPSILAIDTGQADGSVAVLTGPRRVVLRLGAPRDHARLLAAAVRDAMDEAGCRYEDLACVAVVRGPGSFTGLRVGVATAKAIAWSSGRPLVGVSGFETVARGVWAATPPEPPLPAPTTAGGRTLAIAFDAGRGDVSAANVTITVTGGGPAFHVGEERLLPKRLWLEGLFPGALVVPPAALRSAAVDRGLSVPDEAACLPSAEWAARAAAARLVLGDHDDPFTLVPDYMRPSYAEEGRAADAWMSPPGRIG